MGNAARAAAQRDGRVPHDVPWVQLIGVHPSNYAAIARLARRECWPQCERIVPDDAIALGSFRVRYADGSIETVRFGSDARPKRAEVLRAGEVG